MARNHILLVGLIIVLGSTGCPGQIVCADYQGWGAGFLAAPSTDACASVATALNAMDGIRAVVCTSAQNDDQPGRFLHFGHANGASNPPPTK